MKKLFRTLVSRTLILPLFGGFIASPLFAQEAELNTYSFSEGLTFSGKSGYQMNLRGYVQPSFETRFADGDTSFGTYQRFRMRRVRLRLTGEALKGKVDYRLQVDFRGNS